VKLLVDSHTLIWAVDAPARLGTQAATELKDLSNSVLVSPATLWEIAIKYGLGKLTLSKPYRDWMIEPVYRLDATMLPITIDSADVYLSLPLHHRDPFDRMLVAQSLAEGVPLVSGDPAIGAYGSSASGEAVTSASAAVPPPPGRSRRPARRRSGRIAAS